MLECKNLTAGYGYGDVLHQVSFQPEKGELTVIVGPNGSGKSTLLKTIMGQTGILEGSILLDGRPFGEWSRKELAKRIAYLPQERSESSLSVERMVMHGRFPYMGYPRQYSEEDKQIVTQALKQMGIYELREESVQELSGGERQKAYLAMALAQQSELLLLDEPSTYLDIPAQLELLELLKSLTQQGKTVIAVLHDLNQALQYADRMLLMEAGKSLAYDTPGNLLESGLLEKVFHLKIREFRDYDERSFYGFIFQ